MHKTRNFAVHSMLNRSKTILEMMENHANTVWFVFKDGNVGGFTSTRSVVVHGELECLFCHICQAHERQTGKFVDHLKSLLIEVVCTMVCMLLGPTKPKIQSMCIKHLHLELCGNIFIKNREIYILH